MYKLQPEFYMCDEHDEVNSEWSDYQGEYICPYCRRLLTPYYVCPGCGEEKPEYDFTVDEFDLCEECFKKEVAAMEQEEHNAARQQIIDFLKECG